MKRRALMAGAAGSLVMKPQFGFAQADDYPNRTIRAIVPFTAGSASDGSFRVFCDLLSKAAGQPVIVDNRPGANGVVGMQALKSAPADGYTLGFGSTGMYVNPLFIKNLSYSLSDFREIAPFSTSVPGFVVGAKSPYKTIEDVIEVTRKRGTSLLVGTYTTTYQLGIYWLAQLAGVKAEPVMYKGGPEIVTDLMGGSLDISLTAVSEILSLINEGKLRVLATTGRTRTMEGVPTINEMFPEYDFSIMSWFIARASTPDAIVNKLAKVISDLRTTPEAIAFYKRSNTNAPDADVKTMIERQNTALARLKQIAEKVGIQPQ